MAEFNLTPVFRMEMFIDAIINGKTPPEPKFREEFYFAKVAGMDVELPTPINRREFYLAKYAGMDVDPPAPVTRDEMYLALACGLGVEPPEPVFRDEYWLYELSGGGEWSWKTVSGSMIHITDAVFSPMQKCEVSLEPIQDLHGQDAPYPAGGGKNIVPTTFPDNVINASFQSNGLITAASNARTFAIPCEPNTDYIASSKSGLAATIGLSSTLPSVGDSLTYVCTFTSRTWYDFNSGNNSYIILAFASTALFNEHESTYQFMIEKGSTATAFAPYSNLCPITGWTGCEVTRTGKNVLPNNYSDYSTDAAYAFITSLIPHNTNAIMSFKDRDTSVDVSGCYMGFVLDHYAGAPVTDSRWCLNNGNVANVTSNASTRASDPPILCNGVFVYPNNEETFNKIFSRYYVQVEIGATITDYEAPNITTLSVTFPDGLINQWDEEWEVGGIDGTSGAKIPATDRYRSKNYIKVAPNESYYFYLGHSSSNDIRCYYYDAEFNFIRTTTWHSGNIVLTTPADTRYMLFVEIKNPAAYANDISINYPSTITDYHPYHGDVVYGCTVDFVSGVLTVDRAKVTNAQLLSFSFSKAVDGVFVCADILIPKNSSTNFVDPKISATALPTKSQTALVNNPFPAGVAHFWSERIGIGTGDNTITGVSVFKTWLAENGSDIVYPLATPIEIQLTPQQIRTLKEENNVWGSGDLEITYKAQGE